MPPYQTLAETYTPWVGPITVTVIAQDEENRIEEAITSVAWADEILVLDSGSRDDTVVRARSAGARVVETDWPGYGAQKNRAAEMASHQWLFSLDADERVDSQLAAAIADLSDDPPAVAFRVRRRNRIAGKPLRHWPWAWDRTIRLYDKRHVRFSEVPVHESLQVDGATGKLDGILEHETYRNWSECRERQQHYAHLSAKAMVVGGRRSHTINRTVRPAAALLKHLIVRGHIIGGATGLRYSWCAARGTLLKYRHLRKLSNNS